MKEMEKREHFGYFYFIISEMYNNSGINIVNGKTPETGKGTEGGCCW